MSTTRRAEQIAASTHHRLTRRAVIYRRGAVEIPIEASPLSLASTTEQSNGARIRQLIPHWLLLPEMLDFGDGPCRPQVGDQIIDGIDINEVQHNDNSQAWEWDTAEQLRIKVRTCRL